MPDGESKQDKQATQAQARQVIDVFHEISTLLVCTAEDAADSKAD
jgi:mitotic-spindle organizing protein 1